MNVLKGRRQMKSSSVKLFRATLLGSTAWLCIGSAPAHAATLVIDGSDQTVDGTNLVVSPDPVIIGQVGAGSLTIENAGAVSSVRGTLGEQADSSGVVAVGGTGSTWTNGENLLVGSFGRGTLTITDGGVVSSLGISAIGMNSGSSGEVTVDGAGSIWSGNSEFLIGNRAETSELTITNGGAVITGGRGLIGVNSGSSGGVTVDGMGSSWGVSSDIEVGSSGTGALIIVGGGTVTSGRDGFIGHAIGSSGTVSVSGAGSTWTSQDDLSVGSSGMGMLTISDGGRVANGRFGFIGRDTDGSGAVTVSGAGSTWTNGGFLAVGYDGTGTLAISDGGAVSNAIGVVGLGSRASGAVTVSGAGSNWTNDGFLTVASNGTGTLMISLGGAVSSDAGVIGAGSAASGAVTVSGTGSTWTNDGSFTVGSSGTGMLTISDGGTVNSDSSTLGLHSASSGVATISGAGSTWTNDTTFVVGGAGQGALSIDSGAVVSNVNGTVGSVAGSTGEVSVMGVGSSWNNSGDLFVGGTGTGTLSVLDGGTINSRSGFVGFLAGGSGVVRVSGEGSTWADAGEIRVGNQGEGVLTLADGGTVSIGSGAFPLVIATAVGSTGTLNIGAATGDEAIAPGTLDASAVSFGAGTGNVVFNHTDGGYGFSPVISGAGSVQVLSGTTNLTGSNTYTGGTTVSGGQLSVNGSIGDVVLNGGVLGGSGQIGSIAANSGGTIAPGNSIGVLNVAGNVTFAPGSTYQVEVNAAGTSDLIAATGTATISGGTLNFVPFPDFSVGTNYTILTAAGGIAGAFDATTFGNFIFLAAGLTYQANTVTAVISQSASFVSVAETANQMATANGVDSIGPGTTLWSAVGQLGSAAQAQTAFDALSGEIHASVLAGLVEDSRFVRQAALRRGSAKVADGASFWVSGIGTRTAFEGDGNAAELEWDGGGIAFGIDKRVNDEWTVGLLGSVSELSGSVDAGRNSSADATSYGVGIYGNRNVAGFNMKLGGAYTRFVVDARRSINFSGFSQRTSSDYDGGTAQLFGEISYGVDFDQVLYTPYFEVAQVNVHRVGFTESAGDAALSGSNASLNATYTTLGARGEAEFSVAAVPIKFRGGFGWQHVLGDTNPNAKLSFSGGSEFSVSGAPIETNSALLDVGLDFGLNDASVLSVSYEGRIGSHISQNSLRVGISSRF